MLAIDLTGHFALVTGATGQLGRRMVRTLAQCGAGVAIHYYRDVETARMLLTEVRDMGMPAMTVQADVTSAEDVRRMRDTVQHTLFAPDIIVNNAVIQYAWTSVWEQGLDDH